MTESIAVHRLRSAPRKVDLYEMRRRTARGERPGHARRDMQDLRACSAGQRMRIAHMGCRQDSVLKAITEPLSRGRIVTRASDHVGTPVYLRQRLRNGVHRSPVSLGSTQLRVTTRVTTREARGSMRAS